MKKVNVNAEYGVKTDWDKLDEWQQKAHPYTVTIKYDRKQMTVPFFMGPALTNEPDEETVMPCLATDYYSGDMSFEEFCAEFGNDEDSRKAEQTWKACQRNKKNMDRVFGSDIASILEKYQDM